jgi:hypothetical protein
MELISFLVILAMSNMNCDVCKKMDTEYDALRIGKKISNIVITEFKTVSTCSLEH